jgi:hypothetical protein
VIAIGLALLRHGFYGVARSIGGHSGEAWARFDSVGGMLFLFGAATILYGVAMLRGGEYRAWTGWVGVLIGLVGLASAGIQMMTGESRATFYVLFPVASIAITLWITYLGFGMWRTAEKVAG